MNICGRMKILAKLVHRKDLWSSQSAVLQSTYNMSINRGII
jgi:hypothetical protein